MERGRPEDALVEGEELRVRGPDVVEAELGPEEACEVAVGAGVGEDVVAEVRVEGDGRGEAEGEDARGFEEDAAARRVAAEAEG